MATMGIELTSSGEDAVRELLLSRLGPAFRIANAILRDPAAAEDAVQDAALRAWAKRLELRDPDKVDAWFARIVVNVCRGELSRPRPTRLETMPERPVEPNDRWTLREETGRAIARLTPDEQVVLALRFGRDMTVPQIAASTGLREGTVKSRLHSAQQHLRAAFEAERRADAAAEVG